MALLRYPFKQLATRVVCAAIAMGVLALFLFGGRRACLPLYYDIEPDIPSHWPVKTETCKWIPPWHFKNWGLW